MKKPKTYFGKQALKADLNELLEEVEQGKPWKKRVKEFFLRLRCAVFGHQRVVDRWCHKDDVWKLDAEKRREFHVGCVRCPEFKTEPDENTAYRLAGYPA